MRSLPTVLGLAFLLAGCSDPPAEAAEADPGAPVLLADGTVQLHNYTTVHPGGEPYVQDFEGLLTPQEAAQSNSVPFGVSPPDFETCCSMDWVPVPDLLVMEQLVAMRITLAWTNAPTDKAGLDAAACLPWACQAFNFGADESGQDGVHQDVLDIYTGGNQQFLDNGLVYMLGVRYTNAQLTSGLRYTLHVEATPVGDALGLLDPYRVRVPDNATVVAELIGPYRAGGVEAGLMVFGEDDRPTQWVSLSGASGSRFNVTLPGGDLVIVPFLLQGGFVRLAVDREPASLRIERLQEEFGLVEVAQVADATERQGTYDYQAPPGSMDTFPWFFYADGATVQTLFGLPPGDLGGDLITLSSSSGTIATVYQVHLQVQHALGTNCFQCGAQTDWSPANYLDDDGTYTVDWHSNGAAGQFVLFTARYVR
jgi:hypothetical protein